MACYAAILPHPTPQRLLPVHTKIICSPGYSAGQLSLLRSRLRNSALWPHDLKHMAPLVGMAVRQRAEESPTSHADCKGYMLLLLTCHWPPLGTFRQCPTSKGVSLCICLCIWKWILMTIRAICPYLLKP